MNIKGGYALVSAIASKKACVMKAILIGLMTFCLSACADTLNLEFGNVRVNRKMKSYFDSEGTLCIEIRDPYSVQVTIDPVEYDQDGKHYRWDVNPSEFYLKTIIACLSCRGLGK